MSCSSEPVYDPEDNDSTVSDSIIDSIHRFDNIRNLYGIGRGSNNTYEWTGSINLEASNLDDYVDKNGCIDKRLYYGNIHNNIKDVMYYDNDNYCKSMNPLKRYKSNESDNVMSFFRYMDKSTFDHFFIMKNRILENSGKYALFSRNIYNSDYLAAIDSGQIVIAPHRNYSTINDNKVYRHDSEPMHEFPFTNLFNYQKGSLGDMVEIDEDDVRIRRKDIANKLSFKNLTTVVPTVAVEASILKFIKNNFLNKFIYRYKCKYINESLHCACLPEQVRVGNDLNPNNEDIHFIHSTNYLFHIVFKKKVVVRMIGNIPIREGLPQGIYFRQLDPFTSAIGFIYESIETIKDENLNDVNTPVLYNNIYIFGKNANKLMEKFTMEFVKLESKVSNRITKLRNIARDSSNKDELFHCVYIDGVRTPCKSFDDIIMNESDKDKLKEKIKRFIINKDLYYDHNIKYKLGIILYGEPGTGKTTMIHSIASYITELTFEMDKSRSINIQEISNIKSEDSDNDRTNKPQRRNRYDPTIRPGGGNSNYNIKIVEEFDTYFEDSTSDEKNGFKINKGATKKDVVNFIDKCEDGTIFILSTNHIDRIREFDSALIRPGRIDMFIEMKPFNKEQAIQFANWFNLEDKSFLDELTYPVMPSELEGMIQTRLYNQIDKDLYNKE